MSFINQFVQNYDAKASLFNPANLSIEDKQAYYTHNGVKKKVIASSALIATDYHSKGVNSTVKGSSTGAWFLINPITSELTDYFSKQAK